MVPSDDPSTRAELLLLSPSFLVPCLTHDGVKVWDTLGDRRISQRDQSGGRAAAGRARAARPLPLGLRRDAFRLQQSALGAADESEGALSRLQGVGRRAGRYRPHGDDLARMPGDLGGPYLFGAKPCMADAMYAPVCTRFLTYDVKLDSRAARPIAGHHGAAAHAGMDRGRQDGARRARGARRGVLRQSAGTVAKASCGEFEVPIITGRKARLGNFKFKTARES